MFFESHQNSNPLRPRLSKHCFGGSEYFLGSQRDPFFHLKSEVANLSLELLSCQKQPSLAETPGKALTIMIPSVPLLASCIILSFFILPLGSHERSDDHSISIFNDSAKRKISHQFFFLPHSNSQFLYPQTLVSPFTL